MTCALLLDDRGRRARREDIARPGGHDPRRADETDPASTTSSKRRAALPESVRPPDSNTAVNVTGVTATQLAVGGAHNCALRTGGTVSCWGWNAFGQLGDATTADTNTPVTANVSGVIALTAGAGHTCALTSGSVVRCWGNGVFGQLGNGASATSAPVTVTGLP